jgi:hypothetical protein
MKGSISEFELGVLRARMLDAARAKARRGELRISVPIGYVWHREFGLGFDPDLRIQEVIRLIFARFRQLGSARQVLLSMLAEQIHFPRPSDGKKLVAFEWTPIRYRNVISVLKNPFYAGAYAYGKGEKRTEIVDGRARTSYGHRKPLEQWEVLLKDHHDGYINWAEFERNQKQLAVNAYGIAGRDEVGARWTRFAGGAALLRPLWASLGRQLLGPPSGTARLSLRSSQPDARAASVLHLQRRPRRRCGRPRASARRRTDGDRGGGGGGTEVHGRSK